MGGSRQSITAGQNIRNAYFELEIVHCAIDLITDNNVLFDRSKLFPKLNAKAAKYLEHYGVKFEIGKPAGLGGGVIGKLFDIIKELWANKEIIGILLAISNHLYKSLIRLTNKNRPRVNVSLRIETVTDLEYVQDSDLDSIVISELINLKNLSDGLCSLLKQDYPIFVFDQSFGVSIQKKSFSVNYFISDEYRKSFNRYRIMRLFERLKIESNVASRYSFNRWLLIECVRGKQNYEKGVWIGDRNRKKSFCLM